MENDLKNQSSDVKQLPMAVCQKGQNGRVLKQNEACLKICGNRINNICEDNCMELYRESNPNNKLGTQHFKALKIDDHDVDIFMVNDGEHITTFLFDLKKKLQQDLSFITQFDLTDREKEIVLLMLKGRRNNEIAEKLYISPATLKTHINNIFKKIPHSLIR